MNDITYKGRCFCGSIELAVTGEPAGMGYCHCSSCREWAAAPVNAFTLWKPENVSVTKGEEFIGVFHKTEQSHRKFCTNCGGHIMTAHPPFDLVDVYASIIPGIRFKPGVHVHYGEKVIPMKDGLPKFKDLPSDFGGSGETVAE